MSRGITKAQLALTEKKARRTEILAVMERLDGSEKVCSYAARRLGKLNNEIKEIEKNVNLQKSRSTQKRT